MGNSHEEEQSQGFDLTALTPEAWAAIRESAEFREAVEQSAAERLLELQRREAHYRRIIDSFQDLVAQLSLEGVFQYASPSYKPVTGHDPEALVGQSGLQFVHPDDLPGVVAALQEKIASGNAVHLQFRYRCADGSYLWFDAIGNPLYDSAGQVSGLIVNSRNITDRKLAEDRLQESVGQFRALLEQSPVPTQIYDLDGFMIAANDAWVRMWNADREVAIGHFNVLTDPQTIASGIVPAVKQAYAGIPMQLPEIEFDPAASGQTGRKRWMAGNVYPLKDRDGKVTMIVLTNEDITARKESEAERERLQQEVIAAQQRALKELSTPIIPIMDQILVMPLVGSVDSLRARDITRTLLQGINQYRAKVVILDITGVPIVDSGVVLYLNKTILAAKLKGTAAIVTGISDAVAEAIVDLGIDWSSVETLRDLQSGLILALERVGITLSRQK